MEILFENNVIKVEMNSSDEVFITSKRLGTKCRVSPDWNGISVTAANQRITPWAINGLPAFKIY